VNTGSGAERFLTTQHERDKETGLDYRGARFYDSDISRFLSLDPLAREFPSWSAYNYVVGNPISLIDPTGRSPKGTGNGDKDKKKKEETPASLDPERGGDFESAMVIEQGLDHGGMMQERSSQMLNNAVANLTGSNKELVGTDWYTPAGKVNAAIGTMATAGELSTSSFRLTNGAYNGCKFSFKWYSSGWTGGSKAQITTYKASNAAGVLGKLSLFGGVVMDGIGVRNYYKYGADSKNAVHPAKAIVNTGMGIIGLKLNPLAAVIYSGVDAFYPGGWMGDGKNPGAIKFTSDLIEHNREVIPKFNLYKDMPGGF
jgi:RHS repeat-associated protein